jgi:hypothetical protein|tara:strand:- start:318 stop:512 length:195 start_codon:yes stop_codon:yes gene_type:complete
LFLLTRQQLDDDDDDDDEIPLDALMKTAAAAVPRGVAQEDKESDGDDTDVDVSSMFTVVRVICV